MKAHFIAIGGSAMHNLAIALHNKGYVITGSDDEIFEPSRTRLASLGLLPETEGWFPEKIHPGLDAVILGMHARADNPELLRATELGLRVFSYPEYLYEQAKEKTRIVIGGSHGKTTITAMILHAFRFAGIDTDYMVGARLEGFDVMVRITEQAPFMIFEGDEYLTSPIDPRPKFHLYRPHIALLSGIAWDHINVFKTFEDYVKQFEIFAGLIEHHGKLIWCTSDPQVKAIAGQLRPDITSVPYGLPAHGQTGDRLSVVYGEKEYPLQVFGEHNLLNVSGAMQICKLAGISAETFLTSMATFKGAANRLEKIGASAHNTFYRDFAHAPSKVKATVNAMAGLYPGRKLTAVLELHTYSSLNRDFLPQYQSALEKADEAIVYYNPHALQIKRLPFITTHDIEMAFGYDGLRVYNDSALLGHYLLNRDWTNRNLLMMSSGNFDNLKMDTLAEVVLKD